LIKPDTSVSFILNLLLCADINWFYL
jgi:hypothetical protein